MKKCPFCAEQIQDEAIKCRYCGEYVDKSRITAGIRPGDSIDNFIIESELGRGGMAVVFLATDQKLGRKVAVKVLPENLLNDSDLCSRFQKEARLAASMTHANIVPIYSVGESKQGQPYIAMAYLSGGTLTDRLKHGHLSCAEAGETICGVLDGLGYAHEKGIIHRDLKPDNILFSETKTPIIADFGIAAAIKASKTATNLSISIGTPLYMSPEQFKGAKIDGRSDIYSLGAVFYQLVTGKPPFNRGDLAGLMYEHLSVAPAEPATINPEITVELNAIILKALAKEPNERFQTAGEFLEAVKNQLLSLNLKSLSGTNLSVAATQPIPSGQVKMPAEDETFATRNILPELPGNNREPVVSGAHIKNENTSEKPGEESSHRSDSTAPTEEISVRSAFKKPESTTLSAPDESGMISSLNAWIISTLTFIFYLIFVILVMSGQLF